MDVRKIVAIIPARWDSSRFPGKPIVNICGKPMIQWVYERTLKADFLDRVIVATDDDRIFNTVNGFGGNVEMTPKTCDSGTERVALVAQNMDADIIINVQGDEPLIEPEAIDKVANALIKDAQSVMSTLVRLVENPAELKNHDTARVVIDHNNRALYFSRAVIPYARDIKQQQEWVNHFPYYDQIGIYAYRKEFLLTFKSLKPSVLEKAEKLEQLRVLENGYKICVEKVNFIPICVDIPEHVKIVERQIKKLGL